MTIYVLRQFYIIYNWVCVLKGGYEVEVMLGGLGEVKVLLCREERERRFGINLLLKESIENCRGC
jgi:hypothetical protein